MPARFAAAVGLAAVLADGARIDRRKHSRSKFVAGVPVLNYDLAYEGHSLAETENTKQDWTVVVNVGVSDEEIAALCKLGDCKAVGHPSKGGVPYFEVSATEAELEKLVRHGKSAVKYVEPDSVVSAIPEIEENVEAATWGLNRIGADSKDRTGSSATVFVLDTGVRTTHNDFGGRASSGADVTSGSLVECNGNVGCAADNQGHGTHCAGTAAGTNYGVATSAQVQSVKVLSDQGSGSWSWSYEALDWLATSSVRPAVASMSLGGNGVVAGMRDAVDAAVGAGVTVVVAAGNSNADACGFSPAYVPSAVTVGSTDSRDARSSFSCYGTCVDIWAPGSSVLSLSHRSDSGTATLSGTSMACPHVSGAAALVLGEDNSKTPQKVISDLLNEATRDAISGLNAGDTNALLYVGAARAPQVIVGVQSSSQFTSGAPAGYLPQDTNEDQGFWTRYVYVKARMESSDTGCSGFEFRQHESSVEYAKGTGDLGEGAGGNYRYIVPVGQVAAEAAVKRVWWSGSNSGTCTGNINEGRGGPNLYFCWSN